MVLVAEVGAQLLDPVEFDGSGATEMEVKWSLKTAETGPVSYLPDFAGVLGNSVVTFWLGNGIQTWKTMPMLDTHSVSSWNNQALGHFNILPLDYDGIAPVEYVNSLTGYVYRFGKSGAEFDIIDSIPCQFLSRWISEIDGDGIPDIVTGGSGDGRSFVVILGGADRGRGCERAVGFKSYFAVPPLNRELSAMRLMRCGNGQLRIVYCGTPWKGQSGVWLLDVHLEHRDSGWSVGYTVADSIVQRYEHNDQIPSEPRVVWPVTCVDDPNTHRQWAIINWQQGYHRAGETTVLYEVTNGKLEERMVHKGVLIPSSLSVGTFEGTFDESESIVTYGRDGYQNYARVSILYKPFAKVIPSELGSSQVFIDDQFHDGTRDLFITSTNSTRRLALVNFDLRPSSVRVPTLDSAWATLQGSVLSVRLNMPCTITVDAVRADGRMQQLAEQALQPGKQQINLTESLRTLAVGATYLRISDGQRFITIPYLK